MITLSPSYCILAGAVVLGSNVKAFLSDFSSKYSENISSTLPPSKFIVPLSGMEANKIGGVLSLGPPEGDWIAAHE